MGSTPSQSKLAPAVSPEAQQQMFQLMQMENQEKERHHMSMLQSKSQEHQMKMQEGTQKSQLQAQKMEMEYAKSAQGQQRAHEQGMAQQQQQWQSQEYEKLRASNERQQSESTAVQERLAKQRLDYEKQRDRISDELSLAKITADAKVSSQKSKAMAEIDKKIKDSEDALAAAQIKYALAQGSKSAAISQGLQSQLSILDRESQLVEDIGGRLSSVIAERLSDKTVDPQDPATTQYRGARNIKEALRESIRVFVTGTSGDRHGDGGLLEDIQGVAGGPSRTVANLVGLGGDTPALVQARPADQVAETLFGDLVTAITDALPELDSNGVRQFLTLSKDLATQANAGAGPEGLAAAKAEYQKALSEIKIPPGVLNQLLESLDAGISQSRRELKAILRQNKAEAVAAGDDPDAAGMAEALKGLEGGLNVLSAIKDRAKAMGGSLLASGQDRRDSLNQLYQIVLQHSDPQEARAILERLKSTAPDSYASIKRAYEKSGSGSLDDLFAGTDEIDSLKSDIERVDDHHASLYRQGAVQDSQIEADALNELVGTMRGVVGP